MHAFKHLSKVFQTAEQIPFDDSSRMIIMSDCHRGDGSWADDFLRNRSLYFAALTHYQNKGYTYIEVGDGDELWENSTLSVIMQAHGDVFELIYQFFEAGRLYLIFGNHDIVKKENHFIRSSGYRYLDAHEQNRISFYENMPFHEGLILKHTDTGDKIFLVHGHQADYLNDRLWRLSRFLVRSVWKPLELFGVNDPTSTAKNYRKKVLVEKILTDWVVRENQMLIAGHTHRPRFPEIGEAPYFNDGSCVHPFSITGIEISYGNIMLVKWSYKTKSDGTLFAGRELLAGPARLKDYFEAGSKS